MKEEERNIVRQFPAGLEPQEELSLEMLVVDGDTKAALEFLTSHGIGVTEGKDPLSECKSWFREVGKGKRGKLQIRFSDKGPTMDINA